MSLRLKTPLPDLNGATAWLNGRPNIPQLSSRPTLVYFWSASCQICHDNMPTIAAWRAQYAPQGLRLVAVHMPRQEADLDRDLVRQNIAALEISDPCAVDNLHMLKAAFAVTFVPAYFLFDTQGLLRGRSGGSAGPGLLEAPLARMFASAPPALRAA